MTRPEDRLRALRPTVPEEDGWATSPAGRAAFVRVLEAAAAGRHSDSAADTATDPAAGRTTDTSSPADPASGGTGARPRRWRRRRFVLPTVALGLGAAVAGSVAFAGAGRDPVPDHTLWCAVTADPQANLFALDLDPADTPLAELPGRCLDAWPTSVVGRPRPAGFVICVYPVTRNQSGGGLVGVPSTTSLPVDAWPTACQRAGFDPYDR